MGILRGAAQGISHNEPPLIDTRQHSYGLHTLVIRVARRGPDTSIANFGPPHDTPLAHTVPRGLLPANQTPGQQLASAPIRAGSFGHRNSLFARQVSSITQPRPKRFHPFHQKPMQAMAPCSPDGARDDHGGPGNLTTTWLKEASAAQTVVSVHMIYKPQSKCRPKHLRIYFMEL